MRIPASSCDLESLGLSPTISRASGKFARATAAAAEAHTHPRAPTLAPAEGGRGLEADGRRPEWVHRDARGWAPRPARRPERAPSSAKRSSLNY